MTRGGQMFRIGELSRLCHVSVRMLRHYEGLGLLRPAHTDASSGYRYYTAEQLSQMQQLLSLRGMGFSLKEAARLLGAGLPSEQVLGMLRLKRAEILRQQEENAARLERVEAHLAHLQCALGPSPPKVSLRPVEAIRVASARAVVPTYLDGGRLMDLVAGFLRPQGLWSGRGSVYIYHDAEHRTHHIDTEAAVPAPALLVPPEPAGDVRVGTLPALEAAACIIHTGDVSLIGYAYATVGRWIKQHGYLIVGPSRVVLLEAGGLSRDERREVQWPVATA